MLEVCRAYYGIDDRDDDATVRDKIAGRLLLLDEGFRDLLPVVFEFFRVPDPERPVPRMDPEAKLRQIFAVLRRVIQDRRMGAERVFALIEDLHWFDPASEALLAQWADAIAGSSSLLIVNFRPEYRADWMQKSYYRQIPLAPLGSDAIRALLGDLLGNDPSTHGLADDIHARTGGNPFFIEEVVQGLIESGHLEGTQGAYRLVTPIERLDVPPSVQALLSARIDRLAEGEKQVLQTAAVIGKEFAEPILRQVLAATGRASLANGNLAGALETLKAREFLYETALFPIAVYAFKHPLTQEVALGSQLQERRRQVHAAVAHAIEATHADKLDDQAALLAHHCAEAGQALAAAEWHARAATFIGGTDFSEAARHWQRARELLRGVADDPRVPVLGANACFRVLGRAFRIGLLAHEAQSVFDEGLAWAARTNDTLWAGRLHQAMSVFEACNNRVDAALRHAAEWERVARALPDADRRACALWPTLAPYLTRGDLAMTRTNCVQQIAWTGEHPDWGMRDWGISALGDALARLAAVELMDGAFEQARTLVERAIDQTRRVKDLEGEVLAITTLGDLGFLAGEPDLARAAVEQGVRMSECQGEVSLQGAHGRLGRQLLLDGRPAEAVDALEHALSFCSDGNRAVEPWLRQALAEAWLAAGDPARARGIAEDTLTSCLEIGARPVAIEAALVLSAALRADAGVAAAARIDEVLATADRLIAETGACNLTAFVLVERAVLWELRGDARQQEAYLRRAHEAFTRMGATGRARQTAAALEKLAS
jgi:adenylate cyclase